VVEILQFCKTCCFTRLFLRSEMKQGSAFPYISYAFARHARIGFSLMTHCLCHERGTRFSAVPGSTPNRNHFESLADLEIAPTVVRCSSLSWPRGLQQDIFCTARMQNHCTRETSKTTNLGTPRTARIFLGPSNASLPLSKCLHIGNG
jgi:hypothetical protein